jgi:hypothetical protein
MEASQCARRRGSPLFTPNFVNAPYWWDNLAAEPSHPVPLASRADIVVIGSGYTGLSAALQTSRAGRSTVVIDAEAAGWGCSSRNGGQVGTSIKPGYAELVGRYGAERAAGHRQVND